MANPCCPKCPYGKDNGVVASTVKPGQWFCGNCGSYFDKLAGISPSAPTLKSLIILETDPDLLWTAEEVAAAADQPLAQFYAGLNCEDRRDMECNHVAIDGDFRPEVKRDSNPQNSGSAPSSWRDSL